jgi:hypothetical protein
MSHTFHTQCARLLQGGTVSTSKLVVRESPIDHNLVHHRPNDSKGKCNSEHGNSSSGSGILASDLEGSSVCHACL